MDVDTATRRRWRLGALGILAALAGCSNFLGTTAGSFMRVVREDQDPNRRYLAYLKLADPHCYTGDDQKAKATRLLIERLQRADEPVATRAVICRTLGEIGQPESREPLVAALEDPEPIVRAEAVRALGRVGQPEDAVLLTRVMAADTHPDCRLAAIEGLGAMSQPDPRALVMLVEGMEDEDPAVRLASLRSLRSITDEDLGVSADAWRDYARAQVEAAQSQSSPPTARH